MTQEQKQAEAEKFLAWLRRNYTVNGVSIRLLYRNVRQLKKGVEAYVYQYPSFFKFELAMDREPRFILRSVAHEYEHVRQIVNDRIPITKLKGQKELAAWGFAMETLREYKQEVPKCELWE